MKSSAKAHERPRPLKADKDNQDWAEFGPEPEKPRNHHDWESDPDPDEVDFVDTLDLPVLTGEA
ncbi:MAG TPA: hypothetical protein VFW45_03210 [Candidatus Polarisedimenticolia bacterium]|nr:hypothetical protein [Candidatus Polarisedimenticolia bacterium]